MIPKIAIVGPESSGKSTLAKELANYYKTFWVEEYAREYLERLGREYIQEDLLKIAVGQLKKEEEALKKHPRMLICDTNLLVVKVWSEFKYGVCDPAILSIMNLESYSHYLLTDIDIPWEFDPLREHPHLRGKLFLIYRDELEQANLPFTILRGNPKERLETAVSKINPIIFAKD